MTIDFYKRKLLLANARKAISEDEWYEYLEKIIPIDGKMFIIINGK